MERPRTFHSGLGFQVSVNGQQLPRHHRPRARFGQHASVDGRALDAGLDAAQRALTSTILNYNQDCERMVNLPETLLAFCRPGRAGKSFDKMNSSDSINHIQAMVCEDCYHGASCSPGGPLSMGFANLRVLHYAKNDLKLLYHVPYTIQGLCFANFDLNACQFYRKVLSHD